MNKFDTYIISGGPGSGKSNVIMELNRRGCYTLSDPARTILENKNNKLKQEDRENFQKAVFDLQNSWIDEIKKDKVLEGRISKIFLDGGVMEQMAYYYLDKVVPPIYLLESVRNTNYTKIFFLKRPSAGYKRDKIRVQTKKQAKEVDNIIKKLYDAYNYKYTEVPLFSKDRGESIKKRADFILENIKE